MAKTCKDPMCIHFAVRHGFCDKHWPSSRGKVVPFFKSALKHKGDDCLLWPFAKVEGYGTLQWEDGERWRASRLICQLTNGPPPDKSLHAAHACGNRSCVNPRHIRWATAKENCEDKVIHNRNGRKLSNEDVIQIYEMTRHEAISVVADRFGVNFEHVWRISKGKSWKTLLTKKGLVMGTEICA